MNAKAMPGIDSPELPMLQPDVLDQIARGGEAAFAVDAADRIVLWNKECEELFGRPAREVLGRRCDEVLAGRDENGNIYCHRNCPVAFQARERPKDPVRRFTLSVETAHGSRRRVTLSTFAIPSSHPSLATVVHVLRGNAGQPALERQLGEVAESGSVEPLWPMTTAQGRHVVLSEREKEILRLLAEGLAPSDIGKKLFISTVTVRNHTQHILRKLDVHSKLAAVAFAYQHKIV